MLCSSKFERKRLGQTYAFRYAASRLEIRVLRRELHNREAIRALSIRPCIIVEMGCVRRGDSSTRTHLFALYNLFEFSFDSLRRDVRHGYGIHGTGQF